MARLIWHGAAYSIPDAWRTWTIDGTRFTRVGDTVFARLGGRAVPLAAPKTWQAVA